MFDPSALAHVAHAQILPQAHRMHGNPAGVEGAWQKAAGCMTHILVDTVWGMHSSSLAELPQKFHAGIISESILTFFRYSCKREIIPTLGA